MNQFYPNAYMDYRTYPQGSQVYSGMPMQTAQGAYPQGFPTYQQGPGAGSPSVPAGPSTAAGGINVPGMLPSEESYVENILRLNKGKLATVYMTFEGNREWNAKIFKGIIEAAGRDHLIISDPQTGTRYLLLMVNLDYITFDEEIEYSYPFPAGGPGLASYPAR